MPAASFPPRRGGAFDRVLDTVAALASWLALPLAVLLFLQWPLREVVQAYSREANDLGQVLFALYVSVAVTAATRAGTHLAADAFAARYRAGTRRLVTRLASLAVLLPWSFYLLVTAAPLVVHSVLQQEAFPETYNPGYFVIKVAVALFAVLLALQAWRDGAQMPVPPAGGTA